MSEKKWDASRLDSGGRSALKRNAGVMIGDSLRALEAFYQAVPFSLSDREREAQWYACLCMECLWKPEDYPRILPFEEMLRRLYQNKDTSDSIRHRIVSLLDIPWRDDGYLLGKLSSFARMFRSKDAGTMPDFAALADDLARWNHPDHYIQRRWIRVICDTSRNDTDEAEKKEEDHDHAD